MFEIGMCGCEAEKERLEEEQCYFTKRLNDLRSDDEYLKKSVAILSDILYRHWTKRRKLVIEDNDAQLLLDFGDDVHPTVPVKQESKGVNVPEHKRRKRAPRTLSEAIDDANPIEVFENTLTGVALRCLDCGRWLSDIGIEKHRYLVYVPTVIGVHEDYCHKYICQHCQTHSDCTSIVEATVSDCTLPGSFASAELIAHIAVQKYVMGTPLNRLEKESAANGFPLSAQMMSDWLIQAAAKWLEPIVNLLRSEIKTRDILFGGEMPWLSFRKKTIELIRGDDYIWQLRTEDDRKQQIVIYEYCPNRSGSKPRRLLDGVKGYLHTGGSSGYHNFGPNIAIVGDWAQVLRKFDEALMNVPEGERSESAAAQALAYCNKLFALERQWKDLSPKKRYKRRQSEAKPILEEFKRWIGSQNAAPKTHLGKALKYAENQWDYLVRYIEDGRLELSDNRGEHVIKPLAIDRKSFLFSDADGGAECSAIMMTVIGTAIENGLDPYKYLVWVFQNAPIIEHIKDLEEVMLPWNTLKRFRSHVTNE